MTPDELWEKYAVLMYPPKADAPEYVITKSDFLAALHEYGQAVRDRDAEICNTLYADPGWNGHIRNAAESCATDIQREPLP